MASSESIYLILNRSPSVLFWVSASFLGFWVCALLSIILSRKGVRSTVMSVGSWRHWGALGAA